MPILTEQEIQDLTQSTLDADGKILTLKTYKFAEDYVDADEQKRQITESQLEAIQKYVSKTFKPSVAKIHRCTQAWHTNIRSRKSSVN